MKNKVKKFAGDLLITLCLMIIAIAFVSLLYAMRDPDGIITILGYRPSVVITGSMMPTINPQDMIISKVVDPQDIKIGDIITYRVEGTIPNTHRVVGLTEKDGRIQFETKGDAVHAKDGGTVSPELILGRTVLVIPKAGYIAGFLKSPIGFILCIVIPIILFAVCGFYPYLRKKKQDTEATK